MKSSVQARSSSRPIVEAHRATPTVTFTVLLSYHSGSSSSSAGAGTAGVGTNGTSSTHVFQPSVMV
jgi:hypothetical protein